MSLAVVQSKAFPGVTSGTFNADVSALNTVFLWVFQYTTGGGAMSSSNPEFNGAPVSGASELISLQSPGSDCVYTGLWMLPNLGGGSAAVSVSAAGGTVDSNVGIIGLEVSGLGATPVADACTPNPETGSGSTQALTSGATGDTISAPDLILATAVTFGLTITPQAGGWSNLQVGASFTAAAWQIAAASGGAYTYAPTMDSPASWCAGVIAIKGGTAPPVTSRGALLAAFP